LQKREIKGTKTLHKQGCRSETSWGDGWFRVHLFLSSCSTLLQWRAVTIFYDAHAKTQRGQQFLAGLILAGGVGCINEQKLHPKNYSQTMRTSLSLY